ncbi:MAG: DNA polymerase III subunit chi [Alphaproteobacteria bacterium]|nr:DNA polymerase III subunit chi [Rickettsiales bacterium]
MELKIYYLPSNEMLSRLCALVYKIYKLQQTTVILLSNKDDITVLDDKLWTFRQDAFIPHGIVNKSVLDSQQSVLLIDKLEEKFLNDRNSLIITTESAELIMKIYNSSAVQKKTAKDNDFYIICIVPYVDIIPYKIIEQVKNFTKTKGLAQKQLLLTGKEWQVV